VEANSTGGQGSRRAVAPSDYDDDDEYTECLERNASRSLPCMVAGNTNGTEYSLKLSNKKLFRHSSLLACSSNDLSLLGT
jgi:hypothetical protein